MIGCYCNGTGCDSCEVKELQIIKQDVWRYGKWLIEYDPKPIGERRHDYDVTHDDYDDTNGLYFTAGSVEEAMDEIEFEY